jgi:hypothetical protein
MINSIKVMKGNHSMATQGKTNRTQKNTVRVGLATAATIATLLGAQALAFAGNSTANAQGAQPVLNAVPSTNNDDQGSESEIVAAPTIVPSNNLNQVVQAPYQPKPRSHSSR